MKKFGFIFFFTSFLNAEPSCPLCEVHRAYNKEHPGEYEYYEDYLKAEKEKPAKENPLKAVKS